MSKIISLLRRDATLFCSASKSIYSNKDNREIVFGPTDRYAMVIAEEDIPSVDDPKLKKGYLTASYEQAGGLAQYATEFQHKYSLSFEIINTEGLIYELDPNSANGTGLTELGSTVDLDNYVDLNVYRWVKAAHNDILGLSAAFKSAKQVDDIDYKHIKSLFKKADEAMTMLLHIHKLRQAESNGSFNDGFFEYEETYRIKTEIRLEAIKHQLDFAIALSSIVVPNLSENVTSDKMLAAARREEVRVLAEYYMSEATSHPEQVNIMDKNKIKEFLGGGIDSVWNKYLTNTEEDLLIFSDKDPYEELIDKYSVIEACIKKAQEALNKSVSDHAVKALLGSQKYMTYRVDTSNM